MPYENEIIIANVTSEGLVAGTEAAGADAGKIIIEEAGVLNNGTASATGKIVVSNGGLVSGVDVMRTGSLTISGGGTVSNANIESGGTVSILSGATLDGGRIYGGDAMHSSTCVVFSGGTAKNLAISGARVFVNAGGLGISNSVDRGVGYLVWGEAQDTTVNSGWFMIYDGATASRTTIRKGKLDVSSGAYADSVTVSGGSVVVLGTGRADNVVVSKGGSAIMRGQGVISNIDVYSGANIQLSGGVVSGGRVESGATFRVSKGAEVVGITLYGGLAYTDAFSVNTGGIARNAQVSGARFNVYGSAFDTVVAKAGAAQLVYGGLVSGTILLSGWEHLSAGASGYNTVLSGGYQTVHGSKSLAVSTTISKGYQNVFSGATAIDTVVSSGASIFVSGAVASRLTLVGAVSTVSCRGISGTTYYGTATLTPRALAFISSGGVVRDMVLSSGGSVNVYKGGVISNFYAVDSMNVLVANGAEIIGGSACGDKYSWTENYTSGGSTVKLSTSGGTVWGYINSGTVIRNFTLKTVTGAVNGAWYWMGTAGARSYSYDVTVEKMGRFQISRGTVERTQVLSGGTMRLYRYAAGDAAIANNTYVSGVYKGTRAQVFVNNETQMNDTVIGSGGQVWVSAGGTANRTLVNPNGILLVSSGGQATVDFNPWQGTITSNAGANVTYNARNYGVYLGNTTKGTVSRFNEKANFAVESGFSAMIYGGATLTDAAIESSGWMIFSGGVVNGLDIADKGSGHVSNGGVVSDVTISSGGFLSIRTGGRVTNIVVSAGGHFGIYNQAAGATIYGEFVLDLAGAKGLSQYMVYSAYQNIQSAHRLVKASEEIGNYEYYLISRTFDEAANYTFDLSVGGNVYTMAKDREIVDPLAKMTCGITSSSFTSGTYTLYDLRLVTAVDGGYVIDAVDTAAALATNGAAVNTADKMARWTSDTAADAVVNVASGMTTGNAWLELDGVELTKALYGTAENQAFAGAVNYKVNAGTTVKQLAAGAAKGGSVAAVNVTVAGGEFTNAFYAGGFGSVADRVKVDIADGTFSTNVFAGALCNYRATNTATTEGDILLKIVDGDFSKCLYAGAAVMAGNDFSAAAPVHTAGDITVELSGGTATGLDFCVYGGGYATGTNGANNATAAYTAGDVDITVSGGTWGGAPRGGRGIFGGVYAAGVIASVDDVDISIATGTVQNVYGGGWAQSNGTSIVTGDVAITISGGSVGHVFGGGAYSSASGGSTNVAGDVTITISGGTINGNVYAGGQLENSTVAGDATVVFTGAGAYTCGVYGYVTPPSATEGGTKTLDLTTFTGTLSGDIGGFDEVKFTTATAATLTAAAANVDNDEWVFDLAGTAGASPMLTWQDGTFAGDTVVLNLDGATVAPAAGWSIAAGLADANAKYTVNWSFATYDLALGEKIFGGDYDGYSLNVDGETGVLKFSKLA